MPLYTQFVFITATCIIKTNHMMKLLKKLANMKIPIDIWFFFLFLLTFNLSVRKVWFYFPIKGTFNEWTGIYVYLSDLFLFLTIGSWLISILCNSSFNLSMYRLWITSLPHKISTLSRLFFKNYYLSLPSLLIIWSFLSIIWSDNHIIALFKSIKLLEYYLLYVYITLRLIPQLFHVEQFAHDTSHPIVPCGTIYNVSKNIDYPHPTTAKIFNTRKCSTWNIFAIIVIFIATFQSIIGIIQVIIQHSIGFLWLKESIISPNLPGIAKIVLDGHKYIRAYGLFPHPNILAGFLIFSIVVILLYKKMFHPEKYLNVPRGTIWAINKMIIFNVILTIQLIALALTLSKSAIIGLILSILYIYLYVPPASTRGDRSSTRGGRLPHGMFHARPAECSTLAPSEQNVPRGTFLHDLERSNKRFKIYILSMLIMLISIFIIFKSDINTIILNSINERSLYLNVSRGTISTNPILGVGTGQFVFNMQEYSPILLETWQFQPVHNVFLLIWSELGIIGLELFIYWLYKLFHVEHSSPSPYQGEGRGEVNEKYILQNNINILSIETLLCYFKGILLGFFFIMLFDHYLWDIQQGSFLLWIVAGFIAGTKNLCYNLNINEKSYGLE